MSQLPPTPAELFREAYTLHTGGQHAAALDLYQRILHAIAPVQAETLLPTVLNAGSLLTQLGRFGDAQTLFERFLPQFPSASALHNGYGSLLIRTGQIATGIARYQQALALAPDNDHAHFNLASVFHVQGEWALARPHLDYLCGRDHPAAKAWAMLIDQCLTSGETETARRHIDRFAALSGQDEEVAALARQLDSRWWEPLQGRRLTLRPIGEADAAILYDWAQDDHFRRMLSRLSRRPGQVQDLVDRYCASDTHNRHLPADLHWLAWAPGPTSPKPVGIVSLVDISLLHGRGEIQIGVYQGHDHLLGHATEAALLLFEFAFHRLGLTKLISFVYGDNLGSQQNTLALGLTQEGLLRRHLWDNDAGQHIDLLQYGMLREEYQSNARLAKLARRLLRQELAS